MTGEQYIGKVADGSGRGLVHGSQLLPGETEKTTKDPKEDGRSRVGICTRDLQNTKPERYPIDPDV
jgi:hypothetical protein